MEKYDEANNEKIKLVLNRVIERREGLGKSISDISKLFTREWNFNNDKTINEYVKTTLENPSAWNRLSVNSGKNTPGRINLIERMHDYMSALQIEQAEQERFFNDLAWLHEDIKYNPKKFRGYQSEN